MLHVIVYALLTAVLIRSIREKSGVAFLTSEQRSWFTTTRLIHRSYSLVKSGAEVSSNSSQTKTNVTSWLFERQTQLLCALRDGLVVMNLFLLVAAGGGGLGSDSEALLFCARLVCWSLMIQLVAERALEKHPVRPLSATVLMLIITLCGVVEVMTLDRVSVVLVFLMPPVILRLKGLYGLEGIQDLLESFASTLLTSSGVFVLLFSYLIFFSIIAVECFSGTKFADRGITAQSNFDSYFAAFELNVRLALGTPYLPVLRALAVQAPYCTPDPNVQGTLIRDAGLAGNKMLVESTEAFVPRNGDCGSEFAWIYLLALIGVCRVAILPLFAATVLSALLECIDDQRSVVKWSDIEVFQQVWLQMDKQRTGRLPSWQLLRLLQSLDARASVLTAPIGQNGLSICKDRAKQESLLRYLASAQSPWSASGQVSHDVQSVLIEAIRGHPTTVSTAPSRNTRSVSYPALLTELIAHHAFPQNVEWVANLDLGSQIQKSISEVVGLQVTSLLTALAVIRQALLTAGKEATAEAKSMQDDARQVEVTLPAPDTDAPQVYQDEGTEDAAAPQLTAAAGSKPRLPFFGRWSKTQERRDKHLEKLEMLCTQGHEISLVQIHTLLAKRIFIHIGETQDDTFVLLCKGCCSSGQAGLVVGADAVQWARQLLSQPESLWHLTPRDKVAMAIPSSKRRKEALDSLSNIHSVHKEHPSPSNFQQPPRQIETQHAEKPTNRPWWAPPPMSTRLDDEQGASLFASSAYRNECMQRMRKKIAFLVGKLSAIHVCFQASDAQRELRSSGAD